MLDVRRLALLCAVAEHGSISAAASVLSYTPSAASQQLRQLEAAVGVTLVERGARGARLTAAGLALVPHAQSILGRIAAAEAEMHALAGVTGGKLHIAVFPTAGAAYMPSAIRTFTQRHPGVSLHVLEDETVAALQDLDRREVDLVIGYDFADAEEHPAEISRTALLDDPMHLALPRQHALAGADEITIRQLADERWVSSRPGQPCSRVLSQVCAAAGFTPVVVYESDDYVTVHELVAAGVGIALVPALAADFSRADIVFRQTRPVLPARRIFAATAPDVPPASAAMIEILTGGAAVCS
jgi:molybdate transport repressor ModE-like protein